MTISKKTSAAPYPAESSKTSIRKGKTIFQSVKYLLRTYYKCAFPELLLYTLIQGTYAYVYLPLLLGIKNIIHKQ